MASIAEVTPAGAISTVAGNGNFTFSGDGLALNVALNSPGGMTLDAQGNLYFADVGNSRIRELIPEATDQAFHQRRRWSDRECGRDAADPAYGKRDFSRWNTC